MGLRLNLRDDVERVLRSWNRYEVGRGAPPVVDFDCHPQGDDGATPMNRVDARQRLGNLRTAALAEADHAIAERVAATLAYIDALLGARVPIEDYISTTQGCAAHGWSDAYLDAVRCKAEEHLSAIGLKWSDSLAVDLENSESLLASETAPDVIRKWADDLESDVRALAGSDAPFALTIEHVDVAAYWAYWLDGAGPNVRMRINVRNARFTEVQARQFALHEILGHGLQCASYSQECAATDVPWIRLTAVHAQQQVLLEGLAQALPLFVRSDDMQLIARVRMAHYLELVRARLHLAVNRGILIADCIELARKLVPFWRTESIGDMLTDRGADPLLRSYLWSYPAGIDWFVRLADDAAPQTAAEVIREAYRAPLTPVQLAALWTDGPVIGGEGSA
jgi:hypothetical protein